jgi:hypothetical protein
MVDILGICQNITTNTYSQSYPWSVARHLGKSFMAVCTDGGYELPIGFPAVVKR